MLEEPWRITLLGRLSAEKRTATITRFRTQRTGALLARLALSPRRVHGREELADLLWPDDEPEAARAKLRIALSALRRQLEPPGAGRGSVLQADRAAIRLNPDAVTTDVARFEAFLAHAERARSAEERQTLRAEALALYAGELLPGFYDDWVVEERERLEALAQHARCAADPFPLGAGADPGLAPTPHPAPCDPPPLRHVHLPPQWTRFFGRDAETEQICAWLCPADGEGDPGARLVTLLGPGGVGKSRLSVEAARSVAPGFPRGVYFLGLADVREADRLFPLLAARLSPPDAPPCDDPRRAIADCLGGGPALLVLDNLEQIADEIGPRIQSLLTLLPEMRCLVTSRRVLGVPGERVLPLAPLPTPGDEVPATLSVPSVALFVDRARAVRPDFALFAGNADAIGRLCARLDGLPLALELAAAWIGVLTPAQMLVRLEEQAQPLSRHKDGPERHRTLWDAVAWSFELLPPGLRRTWAGLSVFRGGWTSEAMAAVCKIEEPLEVLSRLRDRSLVLAEASENGETVRFRMLESLRGFAREQLTPEEKNALARRHAAFFRRLADDADGRYHGPEQAASLGRMEVDHENLRAAMDWCAADPGGGEDGLLLAAALQRFWWLRGFFAEGRRRSALALAHPGAPRDGRPRVRTLSGVSVLANLQGDPDAAEASSLEALAILRATDQPVGMAVVLGGLGNIAKGRGDFDAARRYYAECLAGARAAGADAVGATALVNLGNIALEGEDWDTARRCYDDSLALMRGLDNTQGVIVVLTNLAQLQCRTGDLAAAHEAVSECLTLCQRIADTSGLAYALEVRGQIALAERQHVLAATLYAAAASLRTALGAPLTDRERARFDRDQSALRDVLGPDRYASAREQGTVLPLQAAVSLALGGERVPPPENP